MYESLLIKTIEYTAVRCARLHNKRAKLLNLIDLQNDMATLLFALFSTKTCFANSFYRCHCLSLFFASHPFFLFFPTT